jgi:hypothetical protein
MIKIHRIDSVDGIIKQFTDLVKNLEAVSEKNQFKIAGNLEQIDKLVTDNKALDVEVKRAKSIANKIQNLIKE